MLITPRFSAIFVSFKIQYIFYILL